MKKRHSNHAKDHLPGGMDPLTITASPFPAVYCSGGGETILDIDDPGGLPRYSLTIVDGATFGAYEGIMDTIVIANDPADGTLTWAMGADERLRIHNGLYHVSVEAGIVISSGEYAGDVKLVVEGPGLHDESPVQDVHSIVLPDTSAWTDAHSNVIVRGAINVVVLGGDPASTPDTDFFTVELLNETGSSITIAQSWVYAVAMPLENLTTFTP